MRSALAATLGHPRWWALALAAFLVRGGILLVLLPIVSLPSAAAVATTIAPALEGLVLGSPSVAGLIVALAAALGAIALLVTAGLAGSWLDLALVREAATDEDVDLGWSPLRASVRRAFGIRLAAHLPTVAALAYASVRVVVATYEEALSPGDPALPMAARVIQRAPDALLLVVIAWLVGETLGSLAARRASAGVPAWAALQASVRQLLGRRGLATFGLTSVTLLALALPFVLAVGRAWEHLRTYLLEGVDTVSIVAALVLLVATWILGLAILGAALAWRALAWTAEVETPTHGDDRPARAAEAMPGISGVSPSAEVIPG
jgi:hypothetical protein